MISFQPRCLIRVRWQRLVVSQYCHRCLRGVAVLENLSAALARAVAAELDAEAYCCEAISERSMARSRAFQLGRCQAKLATSCALKAALRRLARKPLALQGVIDRLSGAVRDFGLMFASARRSRRYALRTFSCGRDLRYCQKSSPYLGIDIVQPARRDQWGEQTSQLSCRILQSGKQ